MNYRFAFILSSCVYIMCTRLQKYSLRLDTDGEGKKERERVHLQNLYYDRLHHPLPLQKENNWIITIMSLSWWPCTHIRLSLPTDDDLGFSTDKLNRPLKKKKAG